MLFDGDFWMETFLFDEGCFSIIEVLCIYDINYHELISVCICYLVDKNPTELVWTSVCQQVDVQGSGGCSLTVVCTFWTTIVSAVNCSQELVLRLHLDRHHSRPAGGAHTRTEHRLHSNIIDVFLHIFINCVNVLTWHSDKSHELKLWNLLKIIKNDLLW